MSDAIRSGIDRPIRSILLIPFGATNTKTGGGQRTRMLFDTLSGLGPVLVLVLEAQKRVGQQIFFPGAADVRSVICSSAAPPPRKRLPWLLYSGKRAAFAMSAYEIDADVQSELAREIDAFDADLVVTRYVPAFCIAGLDGDAVSVPTMVDVDDRDDERLLSRIESFGGSALGRVYSRTLLPLFTRRLAARLSGATHLWVAKAADLTGIVQGSASVFPNVPYDVRADNLPLPSDCDALLFVGSIDHAPNREGVTWFLRNCWQGIRAARPEARLRLVGIGDWSFIDRLGPLPGVEVVGLVEDLADEYAHARACISPVSSGAGSQIKVIEAAAYGRPVICAPLSRDGFGEAFGSSLMVASTPEDWVQRCEELLSDGSEADRRGATLRAAQEAEFSEAAVVSSLRAEIAAKVTARAA